MSRWAFVRPEPGPAGPEPPVLAEALLSLSPVVCLAADGVWVELRGRLGRADREEIMAERARKLAGALRSARRGSAEPGGPEPGRPSAPEIRVVVADHPAAARLLARVSGSPVTVIAPGRDAAALAPLPLAALGASPPALAYLEQLGVRRAGALAQLPPAGLRRRLGPEGRALLRLARAEPGPPPERFTPPEQPAVLRELEPPVPPGEPLLFMVKAMLDELTLRLAGRGLAIGELRLTLSYEGGVEVAEELLPARPLCTTPPLLALLRERLLNPALPAELDRGDEELPPPRLEALELRAVRTAPAPRAQLSLLDRRERATEPLDELLARLSATLGQDRVFAAEPVPTHLPEASWRRVEFTPDEAETEIRSPSPQREGPLPSPGVRLRAGERAGEREPGEPPSPRPVLTLSEPLPLAGELAVGGALRWPGGAGLIARVWGPERLRGQWWGDLFDRDYFVVDLADGARIWVCRERGSEQLHLQGIFD